MTGLLRLDLQLFGQGVYLLQQALVLQLVRSAIMDLHRQLLCQPLKSLFCLVQLLLDILEFGLLLQVESNFLANLVGSLDLTQELFVLQLQDVHSPLQFRYLTIGMFQVFCRCLQVVSRMCQVSLKLGDGLVNHLTGSFPDDVLELDNLLGHQTVVFSLVVEFLAETLPHLLLGSELGKDPDGILITLHLILEVGINDQIPGWLFDCAGTVCGRSFGGFDSSLHFRLLVSYGKILPFVAILIRDILGTFMFHINTSFTPGGTENVTLLYDSDGDLHSSRFVVAVLQLVTSTLHFCPLDELLQVDGDSSELGHPSRWLIINSVQDMQDRLNKTIGTFFLWYWFSCLLQINLVTKDTSQSKRVGWSDVAGPTTGSVSFQTGLRVQERKNFPGYLLRLNLHSGASRKKEYSVNLCIVLLILSPKLLNILT